MPIIACDMEIAYETWSFVEVKWKIFLFGVSVRQSDQTLAMGTKQNKMRTKEKCTNNRPFLFSFFFYQCAMIQIKQQTATVVGVKRQNIFLSK